MTISHSFCKHAHIRFFSISIFRSFLYPIKALSVTEYQIVEWNKQLLRVVWEQTRIHVNVNFVSYDSSLAGRLYFIFQTARFIWFRVCGKNPINSSEKYMDTENHGFIIWHSTVIVNGEVKCT